MQYATSRSRQDILAYLDPCSLHDLHGALDRLPKGVHSHRQPFQTKLGRLGRGSMRRRGGRAAAAAGAAAENQLELTETARRPATGTSLYSGRLGGGVQKAANRRLQDRRLDKASGTRAALE